LVDKVVKEVKKEIKPIPKKPEPKKEIAKPKIVQKPEPKQVSKPLIPKIKEQPKKEIAPKEPEAITQEKPRIKEIIKKKQVINFKLFDRWDTSQVVVRDPGLKPYINLTPILVPYTSSRTVKKQFWKSKKPIIERLMNKMMVSGHRGKKHWRSSGRNAGKMVMIYNKIIKAFEIIEAQTKQNPMQVFVEALEKGSPKEGVTAIEYGGVRYPKAVDIAPQRRIDLALRWITQGAYISSANSGARKPKSEGPSKIKRKFIEQALADQIILASKGDAKSSAVSKSIDLERQSSASR